MRILIVPNALKGSLSAVEAAAIIARELEPRHVVTTLPIADGGDGTIDCLVLGTAGKRMNARVTGPIAGATIHAQWGMLGNGRTAVVEMAEASGLHLLRPDQYDVAHTTTRGVGELIGFALNAGIRDLWIGLGGSATNDGGMGCLAALGARFLDADGRTLPDEGIHLARLRRIDTSGLDMRLRQCRIVGLCDVNNPLTGPDGAATTFGPQKGASPELVRQLDEALTHFSGILRQTTGKDVAAIPGSGAAGGLGAGLAALVGAELRSGADAMLDLLGFDEALADSDLVITAEGRLDGQTMRGKGIAGVAARARRLQKPVIAFAGQVDGDPEALRQLLGLKEIRSIAPERIPLREAMDSARRYLQFAAETLADALVE